MSRDLLDRLPSRPLRNWFLAWHIATGDPAQVIAKGFDLPVDLVVELLDGTVPLMIDQTEALNVCRAARLDPAELWPVGMPERVVADQDSLESDAHVHAVYEALR